MRSNVTDSVSVTLRASTFRQLASDLDLLANHASLRARVNRDIFKDRDERPSVRAMHGAEARRWSGHARALRKAARRAHQEVNA